MCMNELVSIIMPSYNSAKYISEAIESVIAQTYTNWELLITDDCSTDNSRDIIKQYTEVDNRVKLFCLKENSGAGVARNNSIKEAKGRFIAFLDSDDRWKPNKLEVQIGFMLENGYELTYSSYDVCNQSGNIVSKVTCLNRLSYTTLIRDNGIGCLTAIYDTKNIGKVYMPTIRKRQDWGLWLSVIKKTKYAYGIRDEYLAIYRDSNGLSSNKMKLLRANFKLYNEVEKFDKLSSFILLVFYFLPYYFYKKIKQKLGI